MESHFAKEIKFYRDKVKRSIGTFSQEFMQMREEQIARTKGVAVGVAVVGVAVVGGRSLDATDRDPGGDCTAGSWFRLRRVDNTKATDNGPLMILVPGNDRAGVPLINDALAIPALERSDVLWIPQSWIGRSRKEAA